MKRVLHPASTRGHAQHGWLDAHHSFSFANYHNQDRIHFGVLRVLNDDWIDAGKGFGSHPHDNMEIITIPLYGAIEHRDSMGNRGVIRTNDVQVMSAGTGIYHSEYNAHHDKKLNLFQIWIFPKERNIEPRYDQKAFSPQDRVNKWQTVVSPEGGESLKINQEAWISLGKFETGKEVEYTVKQPGNGVYMMVIEGKISVEGTDLAKRDAIGMWETEKIRLKTASESEILLLDVPMAL